MSNSFLLILDTIANKLHLQKVNDFNLSPGTQPYKVILAFIYFYLYSTCVFSVFKKNVKKKKKRMSKNIHLSLCASKN